MPVLRFPRPSVLMYPAVVVVLTWTVVSLLYSLHLSTLLLFSTAQAIRTALIIVVPVFVGAIAGSLVSRSTEQHETHTEIELPIIERRIRQCTHLWVAVAVLETIVSGGLPIVWILTGSAKTYFDYGIPSFHGMVDALQLALSAASTALYLYTGNRRHLRIPFFSVIWAVVLLSRGTVLVLLLESGIIYLRLRKVRIRTLLALIIIAGLFVLAFGYVGDLRAGSQAFRDVAQPTDDFPSWAPSGILWAYIYITTPLNNLMSTMQSIHPSYNILFPNTISTLFPSLLRTIIYGAEGASSAVSGALVSQALSVSTAFTGPYEDMGVAGIASFGVFAGFLCARYWHRTGFWNIFVFSVFTGALLLTLFYNQFFSLPILGQLFWFYCFTKVSPSGNPGRVTWRPSQPPREVAR